MKMNRTKSVLLLTVVFLLVAGVGLAGDKKESKPIKEGQAVPVNPGITHEAGMTLYEYYLQQNKAMTSKPATGMQIEGGTISVCGGSGSSANYGMDGTAGEVATGSGTSANYGMDPGSVPVLDDGPCDCIPGDANGDTQVNVGDAVYLISYVFKGGPPPTPYEVCSGDANGDCQANVGDAVYLISYVFKGGPPPPDCETWSAGCGQPLRK